MRSAAAQSMLCTNPETPRGFQLRHFALRGTTIRRPCDSTWRQLWWFHMFLRNDGKKTSQSVQTQIAQHPLSTCAPSRIWPLQIFSNFASNDFFSFSPLGVRYTRSSSSSLEEHIPKTAKYRKARPIKTQLGWEIWFKSLLHRSFWVKRLSLCSLSLKWVCRNVF